MAVLPGLLGSSPWTAAQRTAGGRLEQPAQVPGLPVGIGRNWVTPPPPPVVPQRQQLANMIQPRWAEGWGGERGGWGSGNRAGYTSSGVSNWGGGRGSQYGGYGRFGGGGSGWGGFGGGMGGYSSGGLY